MAQEIENIWSLSKMSLEDCKKLGESGDNIKVYEWIVIKRFDTRIVYLGINTFERPWEHSRASGTHTIFTAEIIYSLERHCALLEIISNGYNLSIDTVEGYDLLSTGPQCHFLAKVNYKTIQIIKRH